MRLTRSQIDLLNEFMSGKSFNAIANERLINYTSTYRQGATIAKAYGIDIKKFKPESWREILRAKIEIDPPVPAEETISESQKAILRAIALGHREKQIAYELDLPISTVKHRTRSIMQLYGVDVREALIVPALKRGDLTLESFDDG